jgi:hypothetical protein
MSKNLIKKRVRDCNDILLRGTKKRYKGKPDPSLLLGNTQKKQLL